VRVEIDALMRRSRAAAAPSGFSLLSRRLGELAAPLLAGRRVARAGFGAVAGVLGGLAGGWAAPALGGCAGVLFGWPGVAAFGLACCLMAEGLRPDVLAAVVAAAAATVTGAADSAVACWAVSPGGC
jgi:hypothetical protein